MDSCSLLGRRLIERGDVDLGVKLIANSYLHDNSKFTSFVEWNYLFQKENKELSVHTYDLGCSWSSL